MFGVGSSPVLGVLCVFRSVCLSVLRYLFVFLLL